MKRMTPSHCRYHCPNWQSLTEMAQALSCSTYSARTVPSTVGTTETPNGNLRVYTYVHDANRNWVKTFYWWKQRFHIPFGHAQHLWHILIFGSLINQTVASRVHFSQLPPEFTWKCLHQIGNRWWKVGQTLIPYQLATTSNKPEFSSTIWHFVAHSPIVSHIVHPWFHSVVQLVTICLGYMSSDHIQLTPENIKENVEILLDY